MGEEIPVRITVLKPMAGVAMKVQRGRRDLLDPIRKSTDAIVFEFDLRVDLKGEAANFLGEFAQGPKNERFIYVNSGTLAGQLETCWERRAKLSLMSVTREQVENILSTPGSRLETEIPGTGGRDGGPICAAVKGIVWHVTGK